MRPQITAIVAMLLAAAPSAALSRAVTTTVPTVNGGTREIVVLVPREVSDRLERQGAKRSAALDSLEKAKRYRDGLCAQPVPNAGLPEKIAAQLKEIAAKRCQDANQAIAEW